MSADLPSSPLLRVKQTIPPVRSGAVARVRLEDRLESSTSRLTLVVAPAGWGKTSLVSRWASSAAERMPVAWVSLDESDDEPVRFWSYVLSALRGVSDQITSAAKDALPASADGPMAHALPVLLNELAGSQIQHVLVLDDYHLITEQDIHESLEFLLAHLPPTLRVVVASRVDPPLPLARMRVRGELTEVRAIDLGFSLEESVSLVSSVSERELDPSVVEALWEQTEGWAAGLQLAGLAFRGTADSESVSSDRHVFDYIEEEVLPGLTPAQRDLLVGAAPLELLSGSLCDAALDVEGSARVLAELERAHLFVVPLDREGQWYRCHRLLRDALRRAPEAWSVEGDADVLRRAAGWFEQQGRIDDAVRHLLDAGEVDEAARILSSQLLWFFERGWAATYVALAERLPERAISARLAVNLAYAADLSGRADRVVHWLDLCDRLLDADHDADIPRWRSDRAGVLALRGVMGTPPSETALAVARCEQALALETAAGDAENPQALAALGRAYGFDRRFEEGIDLLADAWRRRGEHGWVTERALQVAAFLGLFLLAADRHDEVDALLNEAGPIADAAERDWGSAAAAPVVTLIRLIQGRRAYQRGDRALALDRLEAGLALSELGARATRTVLAHIFLADLELATSSRVAARASLVRARELADNEPVTPFVRQWLEEAETRIGRQAAKEAVDSGPLYEELTDRELSILRMLPGTATQREIGAALFLSINTVKAYNKSLYRKLDVGSRHDAVLKARQLGLI